MKAFWHKTEFVVKFADNLRAFTLKIKYLPAPNPRLSPKGEGAANYHKFIVNFIVNYSCAKLYIITNKKAILFRLTTCLICRRLYERSLYLFCRKESSVGVMPIWGKGMQIDEGYLQDHLPVRYLGESLFLQKFIFAIIIHLHSQIFTFSHSQILNHVKR